MEPERDFPNENETLAICIRCGAPLGNNGQPDGSGGIFCSRKCEIETNFWLYQQICQIEFTEPDPPRSAEGHSDGP